MRDEIQTVPARQTELGSLKIFRALPRSQRRMVGAWCFLDHYGPVRFAGEKPMDVAPHPHIGLQTVTWLLEGEVLHCDSLGAEAVMRAGQLNLMTAGRGIAHAEESPLVNSGVLNGVQLWVALPGEHRHAQPAFDHYAWLPEFEVSGVAVKLIMGNLFGQSSPAKSFSPIIGAEIHFQERASIVLPLNPDFEHAVFVFDGDVALNSRRLDRESLNYLGLQREEIQLEGTGDARVLLIGGRPFEEPILMWWNFVARTHDEIVRAREDWIHHQRFGEVKAYKGPRLPAPALSNKPISRVEDCSTSRP